MLQSLVLTDLQRLQLMSSTQPGQPKFSKCSTLGYVTSGCVTQKWLSVSYILQQGHSQHLLAVSNTNSSRLKLQFAMHAALHTST